MNAVNSFKKAERLTSKKLLEDLFSSGKVISQFPIKLFYLKNKQASASPVQVVMSVPKKNFKKAVDRNFLKRRMREVYRKNKEELYLFLHKNEVQCSLMLMYTGKERVDYKVIEHKIVLTLQKLQQQLINA